MPPSQLRHAQNATTTDARPSYVQRLEHPNIVWEFPARDAGVEQDSQPQLQPQLPQSPQQQQQQSSQPRSPQQQEQRLGPEQTPVASEPTPLRAERTPLDALAEASQHQQRYQFG
jgi:hypothetical protein